MKQTYNLIITGAGGQLGRSLVSAAALQNDTVRLYAATHAELDITQPGALDRYCKTMGIEDTRPTVVINCAAYTAVDKAETEQDAARKLNIEAPKLLAHSCATSGRLLVHISTDYVFDGRGCCPYEEEAATHPLNFYGISKVMGEEVGMGYMPAGQLLVVRTGWLYSPYGRNFALTMLRLPANAVRSEWFPTRQVLPLMHLIWPEFYCKSQLWPWRKALSERRCCTVRTTAFAAGTIWLICS